MQIVMVASGTRGDVQPMIALGKALKAAGHQVRLIAGSNFVEWIESHGLDVYPTIDIEAVLRSDLGIKWVESPTQRAQLKAFKALNNSVTDQTVHDIIEGTTGADFLIGGFLAEPNLQSISEKHGTPLVTVALQPYRPTTLGPASLMPIIAAGSSPLNRWMGHLSERIIWDVTSQTTNALRQQLGLAPHTGRSYLRAAAKIPALYAFSPQVVPPAADTNSHTTGYWFLDEPFSPPDALLNFLEAGEPPIYFGFGSMPVSNPAQTLDMLSQVLDRLGQRGIVLNGWNGKNTNHHNERVYLLGSAPHAWLFPRMSALVHHGGAGTAAAGLRAGKPALLIPHTADQPYWARRLFELGVSAKPLSRSDLNADSLTERLRPVLDNRQIQARAAELGQHIRDEQGVVEAMNWLKKYAGV